MINNDIMNAVWQPESELINRRVSLAKREALRKILEGLPSQVGMQSREELIAALVSSNRKRSRLNNEIKGRVINAFRYGKRSREIGQMFGISVSSIQNIKKAAGLVNSR